MNRLCKTYLISLDIFIYVFSLTPSGVPLLILIILSVFKVKLGKRLEEIILPLSSNLSYVSLIYLSGESSARSFGIFILKNPLSAWYEFKFVKFISPFIVFTHVM